ncbi:MAG: DUF6152 family protein [Haliea sp.]
MHGISRSLAFSTSLAVAGLLAVPAAYAHHSFQASYDMESMIEIRGTLVQLNFRNPHSSVMVMAPDENGAMRRWGVEWGGASLLQRQGLTRDSFRPGDEVIISGQPGRNAGDHRMRMETIVRVSDGIGWGQEEGETFD